MSKKPKPGGRVQISGKQYEAVTAPVKDFGYYTIRVRDVGGAEYIAEAPLHQCGRGPWKIICPREPWNEADAANHFPGIS